MKGREIMIDDTLLQKAENLQETISGWRPFQDPELPTAVREFHKVPVVYSSNRIEGCTYTESETRILIEEYCGALEKYGRHPNEFRNFVLEQKSIRRKTSSGS